MCTTNYDHMMYGGRIVVWDEWTEGRRTCHIEVGARLKSTKYAAEIKQAITNNYKVGCKYH